RPAVPTDAHRPGARSAKHASSLHLPRGRCFARQCFAQHGLARNEPVAAAPVLRPCSGIVWFARHGSRLPQVDQYLMQYVVMKQELGMSTTFCVRLPKPACNQCRDLGHLEYGDIAEILPELGKEVIPSLSAAWLEL